MTARSDFPYAGTREQHGLMCDEIDVLRDRFELLIGSELFCAWVHVEVMSGTATANTTSPTPVERELETRGGDPICAKCKLPTRRSHWDTYTRRWTCDERTAA